MSNEEHEVDALEAELNSKYGTDHVHRIMAEAVASSNWLSQRIRDAKDIGHARAVQEVAEAMPARINRAMTTGALEAMVLLEANIRDGMPLDLALACVRLVVTPPVFSEPNTSDRKGEN